jgi:hypothetical protein
VNLVSHHVLLTITTLVTVVTCASWIVVEIVRLRWLIGQRDLDAGARHDRMFGSIVGIAIMLIGLAGVVKHLWW